MLGKDGEGTNFAEQSCSTCCLLAQSNTSSGLLFAPLQANRLAASVLFAPQVATSRREPPEAAARNPSSAPLVLRPLDSSEGGGFGSFPTKRDEKSLKLQR